VLTVEVDDQQMEQARDRAYREYAKYANVPGFRPGKAPRPILQQMLDADAVEKRAREIVIGLAYRAALDESKLEPYDQGTVDEVSEDTDKPFSFKATVPLRPEVELGDTTGLSATKTVISVTDEDVQAEIDRALHSQARLEPTTEPAGDDDVVFTDMDTAVEGEKLGETRTATFQVGQNMPEIDAVLRGAIGGDTKECDVVYPEDYADEKLAGKDVHFTFRVNHVLTRHIPDLTDEWVREHSDVQTVDELRQRIRQGLEASAARGAEDDVRRQLLDQVVQRSTVHFPSQFIDHEVANDLKTLSASLEERGSNLERYLQQANQTMQQLQDEMALAATRRIKNGLVLGRLAQTENLQLTKDEINAEINRIAQDASLKPSDVRRRLKDEGQMPDLEERLLQEKIFSFLKERAEIKEEAATAA
jgi:trigger factor